MELLFILAAMADEGIPAQTIAPKFSGRFNKGVDYVGDVVQFAKEFEEDLGVIAFAVKEFGLPANLKLSVHSGSDKFSIYGPIHRAMRKHDAGLHLKTAGTTWLEEVAGLALAGGDGLEIAKEIYAKALARVDELCEPYATVIDIDRAKLPDPKTVRGWSGAQLAAALRHDQKNPAYNVSLRQLVHVGFKVAAEMGDTYLPGAGEVRRHDRPAGDGEPAGEARQARVPSGLVSCIRSSLTICRASVPSLRRLAPGREPPGLTQPSAGDRRVVPLRRDSGPEPAGVPIRRMGPAQRPRDGTEALNVCGEFRDGTWGLTRTLGVFRDVPRRCSGGHRCLAGVRCHGLVRGPASVKRDEAGGEGHGESTAADD